MKKNTFFSNIVKIGVSFPLLIILFVLPKLQGQTQINNYCFNNTVATMVKSPDGGIFVGGYFTNVAEYCGRAIKLDPSNSTSYNSSDLKFEGGSINAIVPIPGGGWYVGGFFTHYGGVEKQGLARINADGSLHEFSVQSYVLISSLVLDSSGKLYAAGYFANISNSNTVVCFNPDGSIHTNYPNFNNAINSIALDSQGNLFVGGYFTTPRTRLAKFNPDGTLHTFNPVITSGQVNTLALTSTEELLVGGQFASVNGLARNNFAKFNIDGSLNGFNPVFNNFVRSIVVDNADNFYAGGNFTTVNANSRSYLAKFNADGTLNDFDPGIYVNGNAGVNALYLDGSNALYVGGSFTAIFNIGGSKAYFAKFNPDGSLNSFNPRLNNTVTTITVNSSGTIYVAGSFSGVNAVTRPLLAKFNDDGTLNSFSANIGGGTIPSVKALAFDGLGNLYVGGSFTSIGGQSRKSVAKFNANLTLNAFNPISGIDPTSISALATDSANNIYIGGFTYYEKFNSSGTQMFSPYISGFVNAIVIDSQDNVYIGGGFHTVDFVERESFVKLNPDGTLASLNPAFNGTVYSLELDSSGNIYAGGAFTYVNDQPRTNLAKINPDGTLNSFDVLLNGDVRSLEVGATGNLFVGGQFTSVGGLYRQGFAKFNANGTLNNMFQRGTFVNSILLDGARLHVSGGLLNYQVYINGDTNCDLSLSNPIPANRCGIGTVNLSITPSSGIVNWYDAPINGNLVGTGATFETPIISSTKTFYAQAVDGECVSFSRIGVVATVLLPQLCPTIVNLKLFIQAYYNAGSMPSVKYNQDGVSPIDEVENITVKLHDTDFPYGELHTTTAILKTDGTAVCSFISVPSGSYYLAVRTSNAIQTWTANPVTIGTSPLTYDFTTLQTNAYGNNLIQLEPGVFGIYSGDINQDDSIDASDGVDLFNDIEYSAFGSIVTDLNGDGAVDNSDAYIFINNSENSIFCNKP